jgi:REP element-mobilizing transposase RayT
MPNTYTQIVYHIVFSTKNRQPAIKTDRRDDFYAYVWGIHKKLKCHLYRIGGIEDHVHILVALHPTLSLAEYIEKIKTGSTNWIRRERVYPGWPGWQDGYGAFTVSWKDRDAVIDYIKNQAAHHEKVEWLDEYRALLEQNGVAYEERYLA